MQIYVRVQKTDFQFHSENQIKSRDYTCACVLFGECIDLDLTVNGWVHGVCVLFCKCIDLDFREKCMVARFKCVSW